MDKLLKSKSIDKKQYDFITPTGSRPGVLYGLPKVHKPVINNIPTFRPILSAIGTPTYNLCKFLVPKMSVLTMNEYTIMDSFSFAKEISSYNSNSYMSSLDIVSLFSNIPLEETIDICVNSLYENTEKIDDINKVDFRELLSVALSETCFTFDGKMHKQIAGVSMGSPLGPTLANAFLAFHEEKWLNNCPADFKPILYRRYVDDIFILSKSPEHHQQFLDYMDRQHPNIRFTGEDERLNKLPFLDIEITRTPDIPCFATST